VVVVAVFFSIRPASYADANDETQIRALEQRFTAAVKAKDADKIMENYDHSQKLVIFDVIPPREYVGWDAYKKDWQEFLNSFDGPITMQISGLTIVADGNLAYGYSFQRIAGKMKNGGPPDVTVRVTDVYRKTGGKWLIVHEHVSVPVDLTTAKADLQSKP
jgi:ketosteroid isomerase-like protein